MIGLRSIAIRIATKRIFAYSAILMEDVTDEMRKKMDVDKTAKPFESGANSVVYENNQGNIVVFSPYDEIYKTASKAKGMGEHYTAIPEIFRAEKFKLEDEDEGYFSHESFMYGVEMEKLSMLDSGEVKIWQKYQQSVFDTEDPKDKVETPKDPKEAEFVTAMEDLKKRADSEGVEQQDKHADNVAKNNKGQLKFIDLELVKIK